MKQTSKNLRGLNKNKNVSSASIAYRILIEPLITEAATIAVESNKYMFKVALDATKPQIKTAIEELYKVKVVAVNTLNNHRKAVNHGRTPGFKAASKKAIVTLKAGDSIELFKGV
jgi:large subunit ribosomal protein L23